MDNDQQLALLAQRMDAATLEERSAAARAAYPIVAAVAPDIVTLENAGHVYDPDRIVALRRAVREVIPWRRCLPRPIVDGGRTSTILARIALLRYGHLDFTPIDNALRAHAGGDPATLHQLAEYAREVQRLAAVAECSLAAKALWHDEIKKTKGQVTATAAKIETAAGAIYRDEWTPPDGQVADLAQTPEKFGKLRGDVFHPTERLKALRAVPRLGSLIEHHRALQNHEQTLGAELSGLGSAPNVVGTFTPDDIGAAEEAAAEYAALAQRGMTPDELDLKAINTARERPESCSQLQAADPFSAILRHVADWSAQVGQLQAARAHDRACELFETATLVLQAVEAARAAMALPVNRQPAEGVSAATLNRYATIAHEVAELLLVEITWAATEIVKIGTPAYQKAAATPVGDTTLLEYATLFLSGGRRNDGDGQRRPRGGDPFDDGDDDDSDGGACASAGPAPSRVEEEMVP